MTEKKVTRLVRCPGCRKSTVYDATNPYRPFCSELCKNEDIVHWAEEKFRVPVEETDEQDSGRVPEAETDDG